MRLVYVGYVYAEPYNICLDLNEFRANVGLFRYRWLISVELIILDFAFRDAWLLLLIIKLYLREMQLALESTDI